METWKILFQITLVHKGDIVRGLIEYILIIIKYSFHKSIMIALQTFSSSLRHS